MKSRKDRLFRVVHPTGSHWTSEEVEEFIAENDDYLEVRNFYSFLIDDKNRLFIKDSFGTVDEVTDSETFKVEFKDTSIKTNNQPRSLDPQETLQESITKLEEAISLLERIDISHIDRDPMDIDYFIVRDLEEARNTLVELESGVDSGTLEVQIKER